MLVAYFILILCAGYVVGSILLGAIRASILEILAISLTCGMGAVAFSLFALSLFSIRLSASVLWILILAFFLALSVLANRRAIITWNRVRCPVACRSWWAHLLPIVVIGYCILVVFCSATRFPLYDWDAFSVWLIKSKILLQQPVVPVPNGFVDPSLAYSHQDYPLAQPLLVAGAWTTTGRADDSIAMLTLALPWLAIGVWIAAEAKRRIGPSAAIWLMAIILSIRAPLLASTSGSADVLLACFYLGHVVFVVRWLEGGSIRDCAIAGFFAACMCFTKREGLALSVVSLGAMTVFSARSIAERTRHLAAFAGVTLFFIAPWLIWQTRLPHVTEAYYSRLTPSILYENLPRVPAILSAIAHECLSWRSWDGLWIVLIAIAGLSFNSMRNRVVLAMWSLLVGHFIVNALAFFVASDAIYGMMPAVLDRLTIHAFPLAALLIVVHGSSLFGRRYPPLETPQVITQPSSP